MKKNVHMCKEVKRETDLSRRGIHVRGIHDILYMYREINIGNGPE